MAKIAVCYKWVKDEADVRVNADLSVDLSRAKYKTSDYDKNTIEAACRAAAAVGAQTVGISCGGAETRKSFSDALARGLGEGIWINSGDAELSGASVGRLLKAVIERTDDISLVLCSEGSSDEYARQTGPRLGALLDWPVISSAAAFSVEGNTITAERKLENCVQTVKAELPAVISVLPEAAPAPIPGLKQVMMAKKKPVKEYSLEELGADMNGGLADKGMRGYVSQRKNEIISGDSDEQTIALLVEALKKEGVI